MTTIATSAPESQDLIEPQTPGPITLRTHRGRTFRMEAELWLPRPIDEIFPFFADARNLEKLTPRFLNFHVLTPAPIPMRTGQIIDYKLRVRGFPIRWKTRIAAWEPPHRFLDEQLKGPYRLWVHEHTFEEKDGGTLCRDAVDYAVPGGVLIHKLLVRRDVENIFKFRTERLQELFGR